MSTPHFVPPENIHTVVAGDSFFSIAQKYGVNFSRLKIVNAKQGKTEKLPDFESRKTPFSLQIGDKVGIPDADEVSAIASYMASELNTNSMSMIVRRIREYNQLGNEPCPETGIANILNLRECREQKPTYSRVAYATWGMQVKENGPWDHKVIIGKKFIRNPADERQTHHLYVAPDFSEYSVFYDLWSNIHYGYVGMASGFSKDTLLDGAGLEQIVSDLADLRLPTIHTRISGFRKFDAENDRVAIAAGVSLWHKKPAGQVTQQDLLQIMCSHPSFMKLRTPKK